MKYKVVCFDMDGTLITNTNSVRFACELNGQKEELDRIEAKEDTGELNWIEADYQKANLMKALPISRLKERFDEYTELIAGLDHVLKMLKEKGMKVILVTAGPVEVAQIVGERFRFDAVYGSIYSTLHQQFTGDIELHLGKQGKLQCLQEYCTSIGIEVEASIAIGDSESDLCVFEACGKSIAINYSKHLLGKADEYIKTKDMRDVLPYLVQ